MMPVSWSVPPILSSYIHLFHVALNARVLTVTQAKMVYASSKDALKRALNGIATELQANDQDDIEYDTVLKTVSKGLA